MENLSRSRHPSRSASSLPKKACNGNGNGNGGFSYNSGKSVNNATTYDDVFGGPPRFGTPTLSPRLEDYCEIFAGFNGSSRAAVSSIPILDLPLVDDRDVYFDVRSQGFDYREVFGGFNDLDLAPSYEELFMQRSNVGDADADCDSSDGAWTPEEVESFSGGGTEHSEKSPCFSNGRDSYDSIDGSTEFNISYNKTSQINGANISGGGVIRVADLSAIPGYTVAVDEMITATTKLKKETGPSSVSRYAFENKDRAQRYNDEGAVSFSIEPFVTVSEVDLKTHPTGIPPPSRPPPVMKSGFRSSASNSRTTGSEGSVDGSSPPFFDVEVDVNSAAVRDAMVNAKAKLKSATESLERKPSSMNNRMKEKGKSSNAGGLTALERDKDGSKCLSSQGSVNSNGNDEWKEATRFVELVRTEEPRNADENSGGEDDYSSPLNASFLDQKLKKHQRRAKGVREDHETKKLPKDHGMRKVVSRDKRHEDMLEEKAPEERKNEKSRQEENKFTKPKKETERKQEFVFDWENSARKLREALGLADNVNTLEVPLELKGNGKNLKMGGEMDESEMKLNEALKRIESKTSIQEALVKEENDRKEKEAFEKAESEKRLKAEQERKMRKQEELEFREKKALEKEERNRKMREAREKYEQERKMKEEEELRLKEAFEKEEMREAREKAEHERKMKVALEEEMERKIREAREKAENERRIKEAHEKAEVEQRLKETLEQEEKERQIKEFQEKEENERRAKEVQAESERKLKEALEQKEKERKMKEEREKEENEKRLKEAMELEEKERRLIEAFEKAEIERRLKEDLEQEIKLQEAKEREERERKERQESDKRQKDACETTEEVHEKQRSEKSLSDILEEEDRRNNHVSVNKVQEEEDELSQRESMDIFDEACPWKVFEKNLKDASQNEELSQTGEESTSVTDRTDGGKVEQKNKKYKDASFDVWVKPEAEEKSQGVEDERKAGIGPEKSKCTPKTSSGVKSPPSRVSGEKEAERLKRERELKMKMEHLRKLEEEREREREREKDRMAFDQRALDTARERLEKACAEAREKSFPSDHKVTMEARLKAERAAQERAATEARERAAVERATAEARERAAEKAAFEAREQMERSKSDKQNQTSGFFSERMERSVPDKKLSNSASFGSARYQNGNEFESPQRYTSRLERHRRTADRVAKALAEKNMRDLVAQREQAERMRIAETLDAEVKRWSSGKEGNIRALLSTLQYILGPESGWVPIPLTEVITSAAVKRAYRKATLCVHPDKLQQRGANIHQKYICEKVFDLLKEAWNKFNSDEK